MENEKIFRELGLNLNESKAYSSLIEFGEMTAAELSRKGGVSYSKVYDILGGLVRRNLVKVIPGKTKRFSASDPENFTKLIEDKENVLKEAKSKVKELKKIYDDSEKNPVEMVFGRRAFHKLVKELSEPKKYNYSIKWSSFFDESSARISESRIKKGVDYKILARYDEETKKDVKKWMKFQKNIRSFGNDGFACSVRDDREVMLSLIKSNVTLLVRDKNFAKIMKKMFLATYDNAEIIE